MSTRNQRTCRCGVYKFPHRHTFRCLDWHSAQVADVGEADWDSDDRRYRRDYHDRVRDLRRELGMQ